MNDEQLHQSIVDRERLANALQDALARIAELEYELEQERIHNRNLNKAYDNLARLRSVDALS